MFYSGQGCRLCFSTPHLMLGFNFYLLSVIIGAVGVQFFPKKSSAMKRSVIS